MNIRILLGEEAPDRPFDEISSDILQKAADRFQAAGEQEREKLLRLEHERNLRFYMLHNFEYGDTIDDEKRTHIMLKPFEKLDEKERQIAETGWMLIGELASHKKAKGR